MDAHSIYDCLIVGGGIAGLQAAIQLGRYEHRVLVIDRGYGRSTLCRSYHNVLGWPDGVSGEELRRLGRLHAERLGVQFVDDEITHAVRSEQMFTLFGEKSGRMTPFQGRKVLLATGLLDRFPDIPGLVPCLGLTVYVCPDCDSYEVRGRKTIVMGSGETGAAMALLLSERTPAIVYVNHEQVPLTPNKEKELLEKQIVHYMEPIKEVLADSEGRFTGVVLKDGQTLEAERGFIAFGGNEVRSELARQLGAERLENRHIVTDPRTKMTGVDGVWAAGDVGVHSEQVTIAMGEGSQAAIWIHKSLTELASQGTWENSASAASPAGVSS